MLILGIDPGSAHCGLALLSTADASQPGAPAARVLVAETLPVDPAQLEAVVSAILERMASLALLPPVLGGLLPRVVAEHGKWYPRPGATGGALFRSHEEWVVTHELVLDLQRRSPLPVEEMPRQTWAHRVVPHHRGGIRDADVLEHLPRLLDAASCAILADAHQRDAAGVALGVLLAPAPRAPREPKPAGLRKPRSQAGRPATRNDAWLQRRRKERAEARAATGCTRPPGQRGRCSATCPCQVGRLQKRHTCRLCGRPRAGHVCAGPAPAPPALP